ncbi:MAG: PEGA domain-containing protein [Sandaracinaceae bacterium]|nr:PEGA domain-containing protein [Sandaracinaceae bacterium]
MTRAPSVLRSAGLLVVMLALVSALLVSGLGARRALAQEASPPPQAPTPQEQQESSSETVGEQGVESARRAREEFQAGVEHYQAGRYVEAIHSFQVAASLIPSADLWFNIASAYEQLARSRGEVSDYEQAIAHYRRYLTERVDPPDRAAVEANITALTERLEAARAAQTVAATTGTLQVRSDFEGAMVRVDDEELGATPIDRDVALPPGRHRVEATREGYLPFLAEVGVDLGLTTTTRIDLTPARTHRSIVQSPVFAWVAWGLAAASLVTSVGLGIHAASLVPTDFDPSFDQYADARTWGAVSDAMLAATAAFTAVGIALFVIEGQAVGTVTERGGVVEEP